MNDTPSQFLRDLKRRDSVAWQELRTIYVPFIGRQLSQMIADPAAIEEIVQDVLVVINDKIATFEPERVGSFRAYLRSVARYQCLAYLKRHRWGPGAHATGDSAMVHRLEQWEDPASALSRKWDQEHWELWSRRLLAEATRRLGEQGERDVEVFTLLHRDEISRAEIAERFQVSMSYTYKIQHRVNRVMGEIRLQWAEFLDDTET